MTTNKWLVRFCLGFVKITGIVPAWLFFKPRIHLAAGAKRQLPKPCILISNHISLLDFVLYLLIFPFRTIRFLIAEVLYNRSKLLALFLNLIGGIRVDRVAKTFDFVPRALHILDEKGAVGIFPQSRLPVKGQHFPFTVSTAVIALHHNAPIIPVYTDGNYGFLKRANVVIGAPVFVQELCDDSLNEHDNILRITNILEEKVFELKKELEQ